MLQRTRAGPRSSTLDPGNAACTGTPTSARRNADTLSARMLDLGVEEAKVSGLVDTVVKGERLDSAAIGSPPPSSATVQ